MKYFKDKTDSVVHCYPSDDITNAGKYSDGVWASIRLVLANADEITAEEAAALNAVVDSVPKETATVSRASYPWFYIGEEGSPSFSAANIYGRNKKEVLRYKFIDSNTIYVTGICRKDSKFSGTTTLFTFPKEISDRINPVGISYSGAITGETGLNYTTLEATGDFNAHHAAANTIIMINHTFTLDEL